MGLLGNIPLPSLRSLPLGCPAQHPGRGVAETGAMEGAACWLSVWLLLLGSIPGGDRWGAALQQRGGCQREGGKPPPRLASPTSTGPAAASCRR